MDIDIHGYERKIEARKRRLEGYLKTENGKTLLRFIDYLYAKCYSEARILKYLDMLPRIDNMFKEINELSGFKWQNATKEQLIKYVAFVESNKKWTAETKMNYRSTVKRFFKWLEGNDTEFPDKVSFIVSHVKHKNKRMISPDELINEEEMKKLIDSTEHPRDKAIISLLCESGCRIGEALSMCIKSIKFDDYGCLATINGKTGQRTIRLVFSTPDLANWINNHPFKHNKESALFVHYGSRNHGKHMTYYAVRAIMRKLYARAGVSKGSNPHLLRHSRASILAGKSVFGEFQMNQYFGWVHGGKMAGRYLHLNCKSTEDSVLNYYGVKPLEKIKDSKLKPKECPRCKAINSVNDNFCNRCGSVLDTATALKLEVKEVKEKKIREKTDSIMDRLFEDPEIKNMIIEKIAHLKV